MIGRQRRKPESEPHPCPKRTFASRLAGWPRPSLWPLSRSDPPDRRPPPEPTRTYAEGLSEHSPGSAPACRGATPGYRSNDTPERWRRSTMLTLLCDPHAVWCRAGSCVCERPFSRIPHSTFRIRKRYILPDTLQRGSGIDPFRSYAVALHSPQKRNEFCKMNPKIRPDDPKSADSRPKTNPNEPTADGPRTSEKCDVRMRPFGPDFAIPTSPFAVSPSRFTRYASRGR
jgi:hypothetical protein